MRTKQNGFSALALLLVIVVLGVVGFIGYRVFSSKSDSSDQNEHAKTEQTTANASEADIELQNIGLASMSEVDITTQAVREYSNKGLKGFYVFGDQLSGGRLNPNFEYASLKPNAKVVSAIDGVVGFVKQQPESDDYEVFIQPKEGSMWTIGYDHITNVVVKKGDSIKAGAVIGEPAVQNNGLTRFEIQINKDENGQTTHICPTTLLASSVKDKVQGELQSMQTEWEKVTKLELYNLDLQNPVGCLTTTLTPQQAEGR